MRLAHEIATAMKVTESELPVTIGHRAPTHANVLVDVAKAIQRLQTKRAKLRRDLRTVEQELKLRKKELKALIHEIKPAPPKETR